MDHGDGFLCIIICFLLDSPYEKGFSRLLIVPREIVECGMLFLGNASLLAEKGGCGGGCMVIQ